METFKSIAAWVISPLILGLIIQALGWCFWPTKRLKLTVILLGAGFGVLAIGSLPVLSFSLNRHREFVYRPMDSATGLDPGQLVHVLVLRTGFNLPRRSNESPVHYRGAWFSTHEGTSQIAYNVMNHDEVALRLSGQWKS